MITTYEKFEKYAKKHFTVLNDPTIIKPDRYFTDDEDQSIYDKPSLYKQYCKGSLSVSLFSAPDITFKDDDTEFSGLDKFIETEYGSLPYAKVKKLLSDITAITKFHENNYVDEDTRFFVVVKYIHLRDLYEVLKNFERK